MIDSWIDSTKYWIDQGTRVVLLDDNDTRLLYFFGVSLKYNSFKIARN